jgi:hypothetical protein
MLLFCIIEKYGIVCPSYFVCNKHSQVQNNFLDFLMYLVILDHLRLLTLCMVVLD